MRVVALGGNGLLGQALAHQLEEHEYVAASRSGSPSVDIATGTGLAEVVRGADVVVHLASDPRKPKAVDIGGTQKLLDILDGQHLLYVSIVGVDRHPFPYYRAKHQAEQLIEDSGVPHTIVRATQFQDFLGFLLSKMCRRWAALVPSGFVFQPIATDEVAAALAELATSGPAGRADDLAGPEILRVEDLARSYMTARAREGPVIKLPVHGKIARAFKEGVHTNPDRAVGIGTWSQYLEQLFDS